MSAGVAIELLGLVSGVLGVISFITTLQNSAITPAGTVKIAAGYASGCYEGDDNCGGIGNQDPSGEFAEITVFDWEMYWAGGTTDISIDAGTTTEIAIDNTGRDIGFLQMVGGKNGLCLSYAMTTSPGGSTHVMTGDWWDICDLKDAFGSPWNEWYWGNMELGSYGPPYNMSYYPRCGWLDWDHTCDHKVVKFQANMSGINKNPGATSDTLCKAPNLWWSGDANSWPDNNAPGATPQSNPPKG